MKYRGEINVSSIRVDNNVVITGSLIATNITSSLLGSASYALTASYALNGGSGGLSGFSGSSYSAVFLANQWGLATPYYTQSFNHRLNSTNLLVSMWDSSSGNYEQVNADIIRQIDSNNINVFVSQVPDGRFGGEIIISTGAGIITSASYPDA